MASNISREPTKIPCIRTPFLIAGSGFASPDRPDSTPIRLMCPPHADGSKRFPERSGTADFNHKIRAASLRQFHHSLIPIWYGLIVDTVGCPDIDEPAELCVAARCGDNASAGCFGKFQGKCRHPRRYRASKRFGRRQVLPLASAFQAVTPAQGSVAASS